MSSKSQQSNTQPTKQAEPTIVWRDEIKDLTNGERAQAEGYKTKWREIGLSTEPADRPRAEAGLMLAYDGAGLARPLTTVWAASPNAGAYMASIASKLNGMKDSDVLSLYEDFETAYAAGALVDGDFTRFVAELSRLKLTSDTSRLKAADRADNAKKLGDVGLFYGLEETGKGKAKSNSKTHAVHVEGNKKRRSTYTDALDLFDRGASIQGRATSPIKPGFEPVAANMKRVVGRLEKLHEDAKRGARDEVRWACYGQHDANWLGYYEFFHDVCHLASTRKVEGHFEVAKAAGWFWPLVGVAIMTDRPKAMSLDGQGRLHSTTGKAFEYRDGWGGWFLNGTRVNEQIVMAPSTLTPEQIDDEQNSEIRRIMLERKGFQAYLEESKCEVIDEDKDPLGFPRQLLKKTDRNTGITMYAVKVSNSSLDNLTGKRREYVLMVHPDIIPMRNGRPVGKPQKRTCHNAVASLAGLRGEQYAPSKET